MAAENRLIDLPVPARPSLSRRAVLGRLLGAGAGLIFIGSSKARAPKLTIVDARTYGIAADGRTDDAQALAKAVAAMVQGCVLALPPGTIALGSSGWPGILIGRLQDVRIQGHSTILKWLARPSQSTSGFGPTGLRLFECQNAVVADIAIDGNGVNCIGLGLDTCTSCIVQGVEAFAHGTPDPASGGGQLASSRGDRNSWRACVARDSTPGSQTRGFYLGNANSGWGDAGLTIEGCAAMRNTATGFAIEAAGMICSGCVSEHNGGAGFTSSTANGSPSSDHLFRGNVARANVFHGWQTDVYGPNAERIALLGNVFSDNAHSGVYCHKGTNVSVLGNVISGNGRRTSSAAISVSRSSGVAISNNIIEGETACIALNNQASEILVAGNVCRGSHADD